MFGIVECMWQFMFEIVEYMWQFMFGIVEYMWQFMFEITRVLNCFMSLHVAVRYSTSIQVQVFKDWHIMMSRIF